MALKHAWTLFAIVPALAFAACQGANFGGSSGDAQYASAGSKGDDPDKSEDQRAAGGKDAADGDDSGVSGQKDAGDDLGNAGKDDPVDSNGQVTGPLPDSPCKFFGRTKAAETVQGGPQTAVKPSEQPGVVQGNDYHFQLAAYQGCYGAEAKNNRVDATPHTLSTYVTQFTGAVLGQEFGSVIGEASAAGYAGQCGTANQWSLKRPEPYAVKHLYRGVVLNAKAANCTLALQETEAPFWVREDGSETSGCFALGTRMTLANGASRVASLVTQGTELYNPLTKRAAKVTRVVIGPETIGMYVVGVGSGSVTVTSTHPFATSLGLKQAKELLPTDKILGEDGKEHALNRLEQLPPDAAQVVVNFVVNPDSTDPRDHMVLADGVVTGDLYLQQTLAKERLKGTAAISSPARR